MESNNLNTKTPAEVVEDKKSTIFSSKAFKITLIVFLILFIGIGYWLFRNFKLIDSYSDKVYPGAYILNKDLSGLNSEDLHSTLVSLVNDISNKEVSVTANDQKFTISYKDLDANINYEELEQELLSFGKDQGFFNKLNLIKKPN